MAPDFSEYDSANGWLGNRVIFGNAHAGFTLSRSFSNSENVSFGELGLWHSGTPPVLSMLAEDVSENSRGMDLVLALSADLKVFKAVVVLDAIQVVNDEPFGDRPIMGFPDQSMKCGRLASNPRPKGHERISVLVPRAVDNSPASANNAAEVRELITGHAVECFPNLFCHVQ